ERIVADRVITVVCKRARRAGDALHVGFPGDAPALEAGNKVVGPGQGVVAWRVVVHDTEVSPCLQPQVIRQARMDTWRILVPLRMGGDRKQAPVDVWRVGTALDR